MDHSEQPVTLEKPLRVGELARRTGKTVRALHLYEELGLLRPVHRSKGGFRLFAPSSVKRVQWIGKLQDAGFQVTVRPQAPFFLTRIGYIDAIRQARQRHKPRLQRLRQARPRRSVAPVLRRPRGLCSSQGMSARNLLHPPSRRRSASPPPIFYKCIGSRAGSASGRLKN